MKSGIEKEKSILKRNWTKFEQLEIHKKIDRETRNVTKERNDLPIRFEKVQTQILRYNKSGMLTRKEKRKKEGFLLWQ